MEDRLRQFRETMQRQKEKRSFLNGNTNTMWKGGQTGIGSLSSYATDVLAKRKNKGFKGVGKEAEHIVKSDLGATNLTNSSIINNPPTILAPVQAIKPTPYPANPPQQNPPKSIQGNIPGYLVPIPPPAEREKQIRPKSMRMWRVPQELLTVIHTKQEPEPLANSLLDGEYDPEESRKSFLEALTDWRKSTPRAQTPKRDIQTSEYQQTNNADGLEISINFQENLSYLDKLVLKNRIRPKSEPTAKPIELVESEVVHVDNNDEWDESDHENFTAIIESLRNKKIDVLKEEEIEMFDIGEFSVEDVTECEEEVILKALDKGIMIECVPCSKCIVVEPEDI
ncbi:hypothetical protein HDV06_002060 [Boothiomyces sp. JEL0866]|nr:hypothetical protein HDV06_002060 [Boothiomyces sp. JEL0866]